MRLLTKPVGRVATRPVLKRIGLLTGTFDPIHLGHVAMARAAMVAGRLDEVWVLVNPDPVHKQGVASFPDRVAMVKATLVGEDHILCDDARGLSVPRHDWPAFLAMMSEHSGHEFVFIVGAEVLASLAGWTVPERVAAEAQFLVVQRPGKSAELPAGVRADWFAVAEYAEVTSGGVREDLLLGAVPAGLHPAALGYIRAHHLYLAPR